jgi:hypothetical protein
MAGILYKPFGVLFGVLGGLLAGSLFKRIWGLISDDEPPEATDERLGWGEVLPAAALQGAIFALVKASVDRGGATGFKRMTGIWPGESR